MELYTAISEAYADFATYAKGDSPCFAEWARGVVADPEVQRWIATLPEVKQQPNLVFAAARWHGVPAPGPYDALRAALLADDAVGGTGDPGCGEIRATILVRATQTNEVGRLATLLPVFARIRAESGRPLALIEAGASAGLCLYPDRWGYRWSTDSGSVEIAALECAVSGAPPLPEQPVEVAWRGGVDLNPLDVTDDDAMAWLTNLVWPEQEERRDRLRRAIDVARNDPPYLVRGDLLTSLPDLVEEASAHGQVVLFHSAVAAYLDVDDRRRFEALMAGLVADGRCRWVSNEGPGVLPGVTASAGLPAPAGRFVLGLDGRAVAWTHGHGAALDWL